MGRIAALPDTCRYPADNPPTSEKQHSEDCFLRSHFIGRQRCSPATCHHPEFGYAESLEISIGVNGSGLGEQRTFNTPNDIPFTKRNSQSILNTAFNGIDINGNYSPEKAPMFWDLRASGLEAQAIISHKTFEEMRGHGFEEAQVTQAVVKRLNAIAAYRNFIQQGIPRQHSHHNRPGC